MMSDSVAAPGQRAPGEEAVDPSGPAAQLGLFGFFLAQPAARQTVQGVEICGMMSDSVAALGQRVLGEEAVDSSGPAAQVGLFGFFLAQPAARQTVQGVEICGMMSDSIAAPGPTRPR
jgi:hypothetical protein